MYFSVVNRVLDSPVPFPRLLPSSPRTIMISVKLFTHRALLRTVLTHAAIITVLILNMVMTLPTIN